MDIELVEKKLIEGGFRYIVGIDEVGMGCVAGPIIAAAVMLDHSKLPKGINDSKKLSAAVRQRLDQEIRQVGWTSPGIGEVSNVEIDQLHNVAKAGDLARTRALRNLLSGSLIKPDLVLIDHFTLSDSSGIEQRGVTKGDEKCVSIAAASIVAKVYRDKLMKELSKSVSSEYGWDRNVGYGTRQHLSAISNLGITSHHRKHFLRGRYSPQNLVSGKASL